MGGKEPSTSVEREAGIRKRGEYYEKQELKCFLFAFFLLSLLLYALYLMYA
uniref:Uncharacterized protein n=1 Tax=Picea sitchensis TaxID=3332 RepID=A0A6B9XS22_PICSI|nr:hypothetical protein Q903MT_gene6806 [Picea sitchensis]